MAAERARLHRYLRLALLLQAVGMLATTALTVPDFIDYQLHPLECGWCFDFRGAPFVASSILLGPITVVLLLLAWRWRGPRLWPLAIVAVIDALAIVWSVGVVTPLVFARTDLVPPAASSAPLLLLPAIATLLLGAALFWPVPWRQVLAASAAVSLLPVACQGLGVIGPVHQSIPGELSLSFSRTAVYQGRDLGCRDYVSGWVDEHTCLRATLLVYRGSGDPSKDQQTINRILLAQERIQPVDDKVVSLPIDTGVNRTYSREVDSSNAGLCMMIIARETVAPRTHQLPNCGMVTDYADIHSHWPGSDPYAIGIIYYWERPDYVSDHSVTFLNGSVSVRPGESATLRVRASANTRCSIVVVDPSGLSTVQGLDPKTTDAAGSVAWTWLADRSATPGMWPITVTCGASSGRTSWSVYGPAS